MQPRNYPDLQSPQHQQQQATSLFHQMSQKTPVSPHQHNFNDIEARQKRSPSNYSVTTAARQNPNGQLLRSNTEVPQNKLRTNSISSRGSRPDEGLISSHTRGLMDSEISLDATLSNVFGNETKYGFSLPQLADQNRSVPLSSRLISSQHAQNKTDSDYPSPQSFLQINPNSTYYSNAPKVPSPTGSYDSANFQIKRDSNPSFSNMRDPTYSPEAQPSIAQSQGYPSMGHEGEHPIHPHHLSRQSSQSHMGSSSSLLDSQSSQPLHAQFQRSNSMERNLLDFGPHRRVSRSVMQPWMEDEENPAESNSEKRNDAHLGRNMIDMNSNNGNSISNSSINSSRDLRGYEPDNRSMGAIGSIGNPRGGASQSDNYVNVAPKPDPVLRSPSLSNIRTGGVIPSQALQPPPGLFSQQKALTGFGQQDRSFGQPSFDSDLSHSRGGYRERDNLVNVHGHHANAYPPVTRAQSTDSLGSLLNAVSSSHIYPPVQRAQTHSVLPTLDTVHHTPLYKAKSSSRIPSLVPLESPPYGGDSKLLFMQKKRFPSHSNTGNLSEDDSLEERSLPDASVAPYNEITDSPPLLASKLRGTFSRPDGGFDFYDNSSSFRAFNSNSNVGLDVSNAGSNSYSSSNAHFFQQQQQQQQPKEGQRLHGYDRSLEYSGGGGGGGIEASSGSSRLMSGAYGPAVSRRNSLHPDTDDME